MMRRPPTSTLFPTTPLFFSLAVFPQAAMRESSLADLLPIILVLAVGLSAMLGGRGEWGGLARAAVVPICWSLATSALYAVTGDIEPYYILLPSAGIAMLAGIVCEALLSRLTDATGAAR